MKSIHGSLIFAILALTANCVGETGDAARIGTAETRGVLFDSIMAMTERREAFSPIKERNLDFSPLADMRALRSEIVDASSEEELFYALTKLSNARRDHHLRVTRVDEGLQVTDTIDLTAPIRVLADYSDMEIPSFFIAAVADHPSVVLDDSMMPGDLIVAVNELSAADYVKLFTPWVIHSSTQGLFWDLARDLPRRRSVVPPWLYRDELELELERQGGERYTVSLPYVDPSNISIPEAEENPYPGFTTALERFDFNVLLPDDDRPVVILQWLDFEYELIQDIVDLMEFAEREGILNHTLVIDVTNSSGGARGAYAIQRLVSEPFKTTFGNVRLSDAGEAFIRRWSESVEPVDPAPEIFGLNESRSWLREWARTDATFDIAEGLEYTRPVPFKLAHLPKESDGILQPAPVHFTGPIAIIGGPRGGSHLDQFVSMFADNDLAYVVGMPTGGYSNTWEASEVLTLPGTDQPLVEFMWNIGHTLRPNGEILEGNAVTPDRYIPLTRENFRTYHQILLEAALDGIGKASLAR